MNVSDSGAVVATHSHPQHPGQKAWPSIEADLRGALANGELSLRYQPIIDAKTRIPSAVEALLQWHSPEHGWVPPDRFVQLAEHLGFMDEITFWVFNRAGHELGPLMARYPALKLSLNLPANEVSPERVRALLDCLATCGTFGPERLQVEITERTMLIESPSVDEALSALSWAGVSLAIDDFGTGYSSLSYLDRYPLNCLKIDKSFVSRLITSPRSRKLTEAIVLMAGALGVQAVGEGVETIEQLAFLVGKGCRYIQGYLFAKPLVLEQLESFLADFSFPEALLEAVLWPTGLGLPRLLADNQEQALRLFVKHVPAAVAMFDPDMRYLVASARWIRDHKLAGQDLIGRSHYDIFPATPRRWREIYARGLAGAVERSDEDSYVGADNRTEWLRWEVHPFTNGIGDVAGIVVFNERITERVEAEQRQRESEQRLEDYLATASDWLWETDAEHRFVSLIEVGDPTCWPGNGDIGARRWELAGLEPGQDALWSGHRADLDAHRPFRDLAFARRTAAGEITWREASGQAIFESDGTFQGYRGTSRDITVRKLDESALKAQAAQLELAGEMAGLGHWHRDLAGRELTWSPGLARIAGRDVASLGADINRRYEIFHPDDQQAMRDEMQAAIAERRSYETHSRMVRPDGSVRDVLVKARPEFATDGQLVGFFGIIQDVTEQNEAAARFAERGRENQVFRRIIETLPDQVFAKDVASRFIVANAATFQSFGLASAQDLIGKTDHDFHSASLADRYRAAEQALMRDGRVSRSEHEVTRNGETQVFESIKAPLRDPNNRVIGLVGIDRDITKMRHAHDRADAHARENDLYRLVIESLPHLVFVKDRQGRFLLANAAAARAAGLASGAELIGRHGRDHWTAESADRLAMEEEEVMTTGKRRSVEEPFLYPDGTQGWKLSSRMPMRDGDGRIMGLIGIERDITELGRARREIEAERGTSELYRQGIEILPELFYVKDLEHRFIVANHALARQLGAASAKDVIGKTDADFHDPELSRRYQDEDDGVIAGGEVVLVEESTRRSDGTMAWFSIFKAPLRDAQGAIRGLVGQGRDITAQKHAEETMDAQSREVRRLTDALAESTREAERVRAFWSR